MEGIVSTCGTEEIIFSVAQGAVQAIDSALRRQSPDLWGPSLKKHPERTILYLSQYPFAIGKQSIKVIAAASVRPLLSTGRIPDSSGSGWSGSDPTGSYFSSLDYSSVPTLADNPARSSGTNLRIFS